MPGASLCWKSAALLLLAVFESTLAHSSVTLDTCGGSDVTFTVVVDTDDHEQGNQWYLQYTSGATTSTCAQSDETVTVTSSVAGTMTTYTVTVAGMTSSGCGNYDTTTDPTNPTYTTEVVIPYLSYLVTESDMKIEIMCSFATVFTASVAQKFGASTLTPEATDSDIMGEEPEISGYIYGATGTTTPTELAVGTMIRAVVKITNTRSGYWNKLVINTLSAGDDLAVTSNVVPIITPNGCVNAAYSTQLGVSYTPSGAMQDAVNLKAFKYKEGGDTVYFKAVVSVCASTYTGDACAVSTSCPTRKRRALTYFKDQILRQSHRERRALHQPMRQDDLQDSSMASQEKRLAPIHKVLTLSMNVKNPEVRQISSDFNPKPGLVEIRKDVCIPRGTGIAVLVSLLVLGLFVTTFSTICICLNRHSQQNLKQQLLSSSSVTSIPASTKHLAHSNSYADDYIIHSNRAPLVDSDYLQVVPSRRMMAMVEDGHAAPAHMSTITEEDGPRFTRGNVIRYCKR